jgi:hypothetical protein
VLVRLEGPITDQAAADIAHAGEMVVPEVDDFLERQLHFALPDLAPSRVHVDIVGAASRLELYRQVNNLTIIQLLA